MKWFDWCAESCNGNVGTNFLALSWLVAKKEKERVRKEWESSERCLPERGWERESLGERGEKERESLPRGRPKGFRVRGAKRVQNIFSERGEMRELRQLAGCRRQCSFCNGRGASNERVPQPRDVFWGGAPVDRQKEENYKRGKSPPSCEAVEAVWPAAGNEMRTGQGLLIFRTAMNVSAEVVCRGASCRKCRGGKRLRGMPRNPGS